jgi:serine/threonine protein phosphatase PrpC
MTKTSESYPSHQFKVADETDNNGVINIITTPRDPKEPVPFDKTPVSGISESVTTTPKPEIISESPPEEETITLIPSDPVVDTEGEAEGMNMGLVIGLAVCAVLLIALIAMLINRGNKRGGKTSRMQNTEIRVTERLISNEGGNIQVYNIQGIGKRKTQQDAFGTSDISKDSVLSIVADGMGGISNGAEMSNIAVTVMLESFAQRNGSLSPDEFLVQTVNDIQRTVRSRIPSGQMSGTTLISVYFDKEKLFFISVGDSRIDLYRNGSLIQLNRLHTYGAELDERAARGEISVNEARSDKTRGSLTSYIGTGETLMTDRNNKPLLLIPGDIILLMTDGIFGTLSDDEIAAALRSGDIKEAGNIITKSVTAKGKANQDNFTAVILKVANNEK